MTKAKAFEGHALKEMLPAHQKWVHANKAYESKANSELLKNIRSKCHHEKSIVES